MRPDHPRVEQHNGVETPSGTVGNLLAVEETSTHEGTPSGVHPWTLKVCRVRNQTSLLNTCVQQHVSEFLAPGHEVLNRHGWGDRGT